MNRRSYTVHLRADTDVISVYVPENVTSDVSGNGNGASNTLQVRHCKDPIFFLTIVAFLPQFVVCFTDLLSLDSAPVESMVLSTIATAVFGMTALVAGFLTVSTASLLSAKAFSKPSSILCSDPARNLFVIPHYFLL